MISGIIKVEVSVISRSRRLSIITLTETLIISDVTKPNLIIVLLYIVLKKITTNALSHRTQFIFDKPCFHFTVRDLDLALGNHVLRAQPTDYSVGCAVSQSLCHGQTDWNVVQPWSYCLLLEPLS